MHVTLQVWAGSENRTRPDRKKRNYIQVAAENNSTNTELTWYIFMPQLSLLTTL